MNRDIKPLSWTPRRGILRTSTAVCGILLLGLGVWRQAVSQGEASEAGQSATESTPLVIDPTITNRSAYIPPQCYTQTRDDDGASARIHNPCYVCHGAGRTPNKLNDTSLQLAYSLPAPALTNPWTNLFVDRRTRIDEQSDESILQYVRSDNYHDTDGGLTLARRLDNLPEAWDRDGDRHWDGYVPDAYFHFDADGFDHRPDGSYSGWRAFLYYPFPGTFWPTNGSTDDVLIRLPAAFQQNKDGQFDPQIYRINLAIVEALSKREDVAIDPVDETLLQVDLNKDGSLASADHIAFDWAPTQGVYMSYVGRAGNLQQHGEVHLAAGLLPEGTEFLHSVRYLDINAEDEAQLAPRMKELRYARKTSWYTYSELGQIAQRENRERALDENALHHVPGDMERGLFTQGWVYQGFIEDRDGALRPQSDEETLFCMGCHGGVSATTDTVFSFARKFPSDSSYGRGWQYWTQQGLRGVAEPLRRDGLYEYSEYLRNNGSGNELRANDEVQERFFDSVGQLSADAITHLHDDIGALLLPSPARALMLNKAYRTIVEDQNYTAGRDALPEPATHVWKEVEQGAPTGIETPVTVVAGD